MKKSMSLLIPFMTAMSVIGMSGCDDPVEPVKEETVFELTQDTVRIAAEGGTASVGYRLVEPQEGAAPQPDTEADWIGSFDASVEGTISFEVAANADTLEREAEVTVTYADINDSFTVVQDAAGKQEEPEDPEEPEEPSAFTITIDECTSSMATVSVIPEDKEMTYDLGAITPASLNVFPDDIAFVEEYLIPYYEQAAAQNNMSLEAFLEQWLLIGDQSGQQIGGLSAESEYYVYCIGLTTQAEITTEFVKKSFTTPELERFDATVDVDINGPDVTMTVTPADNTVGYFATIFEGKGHSDETLVYSAQNSIESTVTAYGIWGMTRDVIVAMLTHTGEYSAQYNLDAVSDYTAAAFAMDANGYIISNPATNEFTTGETPRSDNEITVEYTSITGRKAEFTVHTTNSDQYIFFTYQYADSFKSMSDDEILEWLCANNTIDWSTLRTGDVSSYVTHLREKTEYVTYAFGFSGGEPNTDLFTYTFTTTEAELNDCAFSYEYGPYYNGDEAAEKYPNSLGGAVGRVVFPADYKVEGDWFGIWHDMYVGDLTDVEEYTDEDIYQSLTANGNTWLSYNMIYMADYGEVYTLCGFVETEDGNYSKLYRQLVGPFTEEGCSPIEGLDNPELSSAPAPQTALANIKFYEPVNPMWALVGDEKPAVNGGFETKAVQNVSEKAGFSAEKTVSCTGSEINFRARVK